MVARTERALLGCLPHHVSDAHPLVDGMRYVTLGGGKRLRAMLCHAAGELNSAPLETLDEAAAAIEMIHACTLVHDDLPAMDNDVMRRGKPTAHVRFGEANAILIGDVLQTQAFLTLAGMNLPNSRRIALVRELARAIGTEGAAGGQAIDLACVGGQMTLAQLIEMHRLKTGALIRAAVRMGALCAVPDESEHSMLFQALDEYGFSVGLAFQVVDDIIDVTSNSMTLGKTAGKDTVAGKPTSVSILGVEASRRFALKLYQDAEAALEPLGARAARLSQIAEFAIHRVR
ncbi:polyprenyl synthetase family protein [Trinickia sp. LjRoot230]|uniref:polyprenyl synthetase family protein n=1 Tax=Trinickia sp. LjRoot230 TaxID=3342288 RepID=UPI003F50044F